MAYEVLVHLTDVHDVLKEPGGDRAIVARFVEAKIARTSQGFLGEMMLASTITLFIEHSKMSKLSVMSLLR
jgi:hypothetical protein